MSKKRRNLFDDIYGDRADIRGMPARSLLGSDYKFGESKSYSSGGGKYVPGPRCYNTHKPLVIKVGDTEYKIYGGSCITPAVGDADVYIGFDSGMYFTERHWPWKKGTEVLFKVQDMSPPSKPVEFKKLIAWTIKQLKDGKKVHAGCIGGHGRTGLFLAALVKEMTGEVDAIEFVRTHYCQKVVESSSQVEFLHKHFGIKKAKSSKGEGYTSSGSKSTKSKAKLDGGSKIENVYPMVGKSIWDEPDVGDPDAL